MRRREFLIRGAAAAAGPIVARAAAFAAPVVTAVQPGALASADVIWSARTALGTIQAGGSAARIASSSNGKANAAAPDLHCVFAKEITLSAIPSLAVLHLSLIHI